jgi:hypothetical protein
VYSPETAAGIARSKKNYRTTDPAGSHQLRCSKLLGPEIEKL